MRMGKMKQSEAGEKAEELWTCMDRPTGVLENEMKQR
jgi:hypothetical protein